ncbi:MAG: OmpA family protein [Albidovulum sp.]
MKYILLALLILAPTAEAAPTLALPPKADRTAEEARSMGSYALPIGAWAEGTLPTLITEGEVSQTAWRIRDTELTTLGLLSSLRDQLRGEGFEILFECDTDLCGGFDFRFATPVLPEPEMHVDLGDFRFLSAQRIDGPTPDYVSLLVSRSAESGFVQMTRVGAALAEPEALAVSLPGDAQPPLTSANEISGALAASGKAVLGDLEFPSGAAQLADERFASLTALAEWMKVNPDLHVSLVGHTDAEGSLQANVGLSRLRAQSVMKRLVSEYNIDPERLTSDGVGFLSPIASNLTADGRTKNRRVEAIISSTR